ncbi:unnamed protein product [Urochloa humidicola]
MAGKRRGRRNPQTLASSSLPPPPPPPEAELTAVLPDNVLRFILQRLSAADLLRAALACRRWLRVVSLAAPRAPPLLGYFFHPKDSPPRPPVVWHNRVLYPAIFAPLDDATASPRLSLDFEPSASRGFAIQDVRHGLLLLLPCPRPQAAFPSILVLDPASRRRTLLPPPPPDDPWHRLGTRHFIGVAVLSRAHPSRLCFEAVCLTVDGDRPRAWVATVREGDCTWRPLPPSQEVKIDFDHIWLEKECVHAAGTIYWHICNSHRTLALDPRTLEFSFLLAPAQMGLFHKYRIGEMPEDGRLCIASAERQRLKVWVQGDDKGSDNGWLLIREMRMRKVFNTIPDLPKDKASRIESIWLSDIDSARTGKVFFETKGYGRYSFHMETGKLERLMTDSGKEYGYCIYPYFLAWPPAFLAPSE